MARYVAKQDACRSRGQCKNRAGMNVAIGTLISRANYVSIKERAMIPAQGLHMYQKKFRAKLIGI